MAPCNSVILYRKAYGLWNDPICYVDSDGFPTICIIAFMSEKVMKEQPCQSCNVYHALKRVQHTYIYTAWKGWLIANPPKIEERYSNG